MGFRMTINGLCECSCHNSILSSDDQPYIWPAGLTSYLQIMTGKYLQCEESDTVGDWVYESALRILQSRTYMYVRSTQVTLVMN